MAIRPPSWLEAGGPYPADDDRLLLQSLLGGSPNQALASGIVAAADYAVTQTGAGTMALKVASGAAWVVGTQSGTEGVYNVVNDDNTQSVTIGTADATNPRIDLVVLQVRNSEYSGTHDDAVLAVVAGTPAASPSAPSAPADSLVLAQVRVNASVTSIVTANITDRRPIFAPPSSIPSGTIVDFAGTVAPAGWLVADGSPQSRAGYTALFAALGTTWGPGDGSTTFNLPDLRGRSTVGAGAVGTNTQPTVALGATGGEQNHTLSSGELPSHAHSATDSGHSHAAPAPTSGFVTYYSPSSGYMATASTPGYDSGHPINVQSGTANGAASVTIGNTGGGTSHNNMHPYAGVQKIIKV